MPLCLCLKSDSMKWRLLLIQKRLTICSEKLVLLAINSGFWDCPINLLLCISVLHIETKCTTNLNPTSLPSQISGTKIYLRKRNTDFMKKKNELKKRYCWRRTYSESKNEISVFRAIFRTMKILSQTLTVFSGTFEV